MHELFPEKWVDNHSDELFAYARPRVNNSSIAEDLVQETFLSAWNARAGFKGEASERTWLFTILKHKIIDHYRKRAREIDTNPPANDATDRFFDEEEHWTASDEPGNWGTDYPAQLRNKEFYTILMACKDKLQLMQRTAFVLKYMEEMETADICKEMNITASNYWVLIHRAKLGLRDCLEKNWINN
jgi:RNA polymerase sigma-70 factor (ECF subfamily)